jgi:hypothetical protein
VTTTVSTFPVAATYLCYLIGPTDWTLCWATVISYSLCSIREDLIGIVDLLESNLSFFVARIAIRVILPRKTSE